MEERDENVGRGVVFPEAQLATVRTRCVSTGRMIASDLNASWLVPAHLLVRSPFLLFRQSWKWRFVDRIRLRGENPVQYIIQQKAGDVISWDKK